MHKNIIVKMEYGSHLYGTATEKSDKDYATVVMPTLEQLLLQAGKFSDCKSTGNDISKNGSGDIDDNVYSLPYFLDMCIRGDTTALDMLHCENPIHTSAIWQELRHNRKKFYTKNLKAYVGYTKSQAMKYGVKGDKVKEIDKTIKALNDIISSSPSNIYQKLSFVWGALPDGEYIFRQRGNGRLNVYNVFGKKYEETVSVGYLLERLQLKKESYGHRAKAASENNGMDWKAIHHALRVATQTLLIFKEGDFSYPLPNNDFLMKVKTGNVHYLTDVAPEFDNFFRALETLSLKSDLPDACDIEYWEDWLLEVYTEHFGLEGLLGD